MAALRKRLPTVVTIVWFIPSVHSAVDYQVAVFRKRLPTVGTFEGLHSSVSTNMTC